MPERVMVVSGAFATHTTKLYNYYVCPRNWRVEELVYIAVVYFGELKYVGKINQRIDWEYTENRNLNGLLGNNLNLQIMNDLHKFEAILNVGNHYLFDLSTVSNYFNQEAILSFQGRGAFVRSHRYFDSLNDFHGAFSGNFPFENDIENLTFTAINDGETNI